MPWNLITSEIKHDMRLFISMLQEEPFVYKITKVKNTSPKGIITCTVKQDMFEPLHDYVCLDPSSENFGGMYADYYSSDVEPHQEDCTVHGTSLVIDAANYNIRLGSSKVLTAKIYDIDKKEITEKFQNYNCIWDFYLIDSNFTKKTVDDLIIVDEDYSLKKENKFKCKIKFIGDEKYLNCNINVICKIEDLTSEATLDVIAL